MINTLDVIKELERELATRKAVYPDWVNKNKLKPEIADHRKQAMERSIEITQSYQKIQNWLVDNKQALKEYGLWDQNAYIGVIAILIRAMAVIDKEKNNGSGNKR